MSKQSIRSVEEGGKLASIIGAGLAGLTGFSLAAAGSWIVYSNLAINHNVPLPDALPAERDSFESRTAGLLSYYRSRGQADTPLVLIHSINAAASAYEMRPLFLRYMARRPVFALDLPGFGFSERSKREYSPELYENAILEFMETQVGQPADVVALSLGCEFAARAALAQPERFNSLALISPTGLGRGSSERGSQRASRKGTSNTLHDAFAFSAWARPFYDLIATRPSIVYFLQQSFVGSVPPDLIDFAYASSHQPGAEHAPLYFISGKLFTPDIRPAVYERLQVPTLVLYDQDAFTSFDMLPDLLEKNPSWQAIRISPTLGLLQFERLEDTGEVLDNFWK